MILKDEVENEDCISEISIPIDCKLFLEDIFDDYSAMPLNYEGENLTEFGEYYACFVNSLKKEFDRHEVDLFINKLGYDTDELLVVKDGLQISDVNINKIIHMRNDMYPSDSMCVILALLPQFRGRLCVYLPYVGDNNDAAHYLYLSYSPTVENNSNTTMSLLWAEIIQHVKFAATKKPINVAVCYSHTSIMNNTFKSIAYKKSDNYYYWDIDKELLLLNKSFENFTSQLYDLFDKLQFEIDEDLNVELCAIHDADPTIFTL